MKKVILLVCVLLLCGCGTKTMKCESTSKQEKYTMNSSYTVYYGGGVVKKVSTVETVESSDSEFLTKVEKDLNDSYNRSEENYGGYTYNITNKDGKVTSTVTVDYKKMDLDKFIKDNEAMKSYVNDKNKITLEGIKKMYESMGAKCE